MAEGNVMRWEKLQERLKGDDAPGAKARRAARRKAGGAKAQSRTAAPSRSHRAGSKTRRKATAAKSVRGTVRGGARRTSGRKTAPRTASAAYRRALPGRDEDMQRELDARVNAAMEIRRGIEAKIDRGLAELDAEKRAAGGKRRDRK